MRARRSGETVRANAHQHRVQQIEQLMLALLNAVHIGELIGIEVTVNPFLKHLGVSEDCLQRIPKLVAQQFDQLARGAAGRVCERPGFLLAHLQLCDQVFGRCIVLRKLPITVARITPNSAGSTLKIRMAGAVLNERGKV